MTSASAAVPAQEAESAGPPGRWPRFAPAAGLRNVVHCARLGWIPIVSNAIAQGLLVLAIWVEWAPAWQLALGALTSWAIFVAALGFLTRLALVRSGECPGLRDLGASTLRRLPVLYGWMAVETALVMIGFSFMFWPGVVVALLLAYTPIVILDDLGQRHGRNPMWKSVMAIIRRPGGYVVTIVFFGAVAAIVGIGTGLSAGFLPTPWAQILNWTLKGFLAYWILASLTALWRLPAPRRD